MHISVRPIITTTIPFALLLVVVVAMILCHIHEDAEEAQEDENANDVLYFKKKRYK